MNSTVFAMQLKKVI